jgi:hypothetical protein
VSEVKAALGCRHPEELGWGIAIMANGDAV